MWKLPISLERKEEGGATNKKFPSSSDWQSDKTNIFLANRTTDNHSQVWNTKNNYKERRTHTEQNQIQLFLIIQRIQGHYKWLVTLSLSLSMPSSWSSSLASFCILIIFLWFHHLPPQDYPEWMLLLGFACCVAFLVAGLPGNIITILALARCKKVIVALGLYHNSLMPESSSSKRGMILQDVNVVNVAMQVQLGRFIASASAR